MLTAWFLPFQSNYIASQITSTSSQGITLEHFQARLQEEANSPKAGFLESCGITSKAFTQLHNSLWYRLVREDMFSLWEASDEAA